MIECAAYIFIPIPKDSCKKRVCTFQLDMDPSQGILKLAELHNQRKEILGQIRVLEKEADKIQEAIREIEASLHPVLDTARTEGQKFVVAEHSVAITPSVSRQTIRITERYTPILNSGLSKLYDQWQTGGIPTREDFVRVGVAVLAEERVVQERPSIQYKRTKG